MDEIEHRHLRSALEFAVLMASEGQKRRPPLPLPKDLKPYLGRRRIPAKALGPVRRIIEADDDFRRLLSAGAVPELVDEIGVLWLSRPDGWQDRIATLIDVADEQEATEDLRRQLRHAEKVREGAEVAAVRTRTELVQRDEMLTDRGREIDELRKELGKLAEEAAELRAELTDTRNEVRHARDRERAAESKLEAALRDRDAAVSAQGDAAAVRDEVLATRVGEVGSVAEISDAAQAAQSLANRLSSLLPRLDDSAGSAARPDQRSPLSLPGGVISSSGEAAEFFARSDAAFLIDGYNVAKSAWHGRRLEEQRTLLLDAVENLARRFGTDITVIFDGASVVGAHAARRRLVRVVYSPDGVIADDVIRDEVRRLPASRAVVVVTDDNVIISDVRADGANAVSSNAFIAIL